MEFNTQSIARENVLGEVMEYERDRKEAQKTIRLVSSLKNHANSKKTMILLLDEISELKEIQKLCDKFIRRNKPKAIHFLN